MKRRDKALLRQLGVIVLTAIVIACPLILVNGFFFIDILGWHSLAFPIFILVGLFLAGLIVELKLKRTTRRNADEAG